MAASKGRSADARAAVAAGMAAARERGVRLGRPAAPLPAAGQRVTQLRAQGLSLSDIAAVLNDEGVATSSGRPWTKASVQYVVRRLSEIADREPSP